MIKKYYLSQTKRFQRITAALVVIIVAGIGTYLIISSHAAAPYVSTAAVKGSLAGGAQQVQSCSGTSNGGCVLFGGAGSITVSQGTSRNLSQDFLGFNGDGGANVWSNPSFFPALNTLKPETIRGILGGTPANYLNWQTGQYFITSNHVSWIKPGLPVAPFTLSTYVNALKASNSTGVFNVNVMTYCPADNANPTSTAQAGANCTQAQACGPNPAAYTTACTSTDYTWGLNFQIAMLKTAQSLGVPIKYIELGNEVNAGGSNVDYGYYFPSPQAYINKVNAWIPVLKQNFPGAQIAIVGDPGTICQHVNSPTPNTAEPAWDKAIISGVQGENAIVFHTYYVSNIPTGGSVNNPQDLATLLSTATQSCSSNFQNYRLNLLPSGVSAWITEWNLWSDPGVLEHGSWAQGLTEASYAIDLARQPQVALMDAHDLVSTQAWGALFANSNSYITTLQGLPFLTPTPVPTTQPFGKTGGGFALSALARSLHGATSTTSLNFGANPAIAGSSVPGLMGQSFTVNGKTNLYFVNLSANNESLNLGSLAGNYSVLQYASSPTNFVTGDNSIPTSSSTATDTLNVPAYSVTSLVSN